ncbi:hypothetical protein HJFPF1_07750 [Paramyrothecium foliicola]|nr:hypothetical protein HJFPF1_07750 [Paramyrothecium foliicola]
MEGISAPQGYLVIDSPNAEENGSYSCPHVSSKKGCEKDCDNGCAGGCDGMSFDTVIDCISHEIDWHTPPYECNECKETFGAYPALERHAASSGHEQIWLCHYSRCPEAGHEFPSHMALLLHVIGSLAHQRAREARYNTRGVARVSYRERSWKEEGEESGSEHNTVERDYKCGEACCYKYNHKLSSAGELDRHVKSHGHLCAVALDQSLVAQEQLTEEELEAKRQAARLWQCDSECCPQFGKPLAGSTSYFNHIATTAHLEGPPAKKAKVERVRFRAECTVQLCPKHGHEFSSPSKFTKHVNSQAHIRSSMLEETRFTRARFATPAPLTVEPTTPRQPATLTTFGGLVSPLTPTGFCMPSTPRKPLVSYESDDESEAQILREKIEELEKANRNLSEKVVRLEANLLEKDGLQDDNAPLENTVHKLERELSEYLDLGLQPSPSGPPNGSRINAPNGGNQEVIMLD